MNGEAPPKETPSGVYWLLTDVPIDNSEKVTVTGRVDALLDFSWTFEEAFKDWTVASGRCVVPESSVTAERFSGALAPPELRATSGAGVTLGRCGEVRSASLASPAPWAPDLVVAVLEAVASEAAVVRILGKAEAGCAKDTAVLSIATTAIPEAVPARRRRLPMTNSQTTQRAELTGNAAR